MPFLTSKKWAISVSVAVIALAITCAFLALAALSIVYYHHLSHEDLRVQYANGANHYTDMTSQYTRHFETHGNWPVPGTYSKTGFQYQNTLTNNNGEREDVYRADYDGGMRVSFELRKDGTIHVWPYPV